MSFEIKLHIPECQRLPYRKIVPSATRLILGRSERPIPIGLWIETPAFLRELAGKPFAHSNQLAAVGKAVLQVVKQEGRFRVSYVERQWLFTEGTTVMITGRDREDLNTVLATWDYGEEPMVALRRLGEGRKLLSLPPVVAAEYSIRSLSVALPPPAVLVSNVMEMERPDMALGGCGEGCPIAVGIGSKFMHLVFDHRIFDAPDEVLFVERFNEEISR